MRISLTLTRSGWVDGVDYGVRDVFGLQPLQVHEAAQALTGVLVRDVVRQLGVDGAQVRRWTPGCCLRGAPAVRPSEMAFTASLVPA